MAESIKLLIIAEYFGNVFYMQIISEVINRCL